MLKLEIIDGSLQVSNGADIILVAPKEYCAINVLRLYEATPFIEIFNKYQGGNTTLFVQPLDSCEDSTNTPFTVNSFIAFAEANLGFSSGGSTPTASIIQVGTGSCSSVRIGVGNNASGSWSSAEGGRCNTASGYQGFGGGGCGNVAFGCSSTVVGGLANISNGDGSFIGGGFQNCVTGLSGFVGGGALIIYWRGISKLCNWTIFFCRRRFSKYSYRTIFFCRRGFSKYSYRTIFFCRRGCSEFSFW